jgi:hypothetical protein
MFDLETRDLFDPLQIPICEQDSAGGSTRRGHRFINVARPGVIRTMKKMRVFKFINPFGWRERILRENLWPGG